MRTAQDNHPYCDECHTGYSNRKYIDFSNGLTYCSDCLRAAVQMLEQAPSKERSITDNCDYCGRSPGFCQCR